MLIPKNQDLSRLEWPRVDNHISNAIMAGRARAPPGLITARAICKCSHKHNTIGTKISVENNTSERNEMAVVLWLHILPKDVYVYVHVYVYVYIYIYIYMHAVPVKVWRFIRVKR